LIQNRGYSQAKITSNVECEIFQTILDEAKDSYKAEIIIELTSNSVEDMEQNVEKIVSWVKSKSKKD
jgi:adenylate kinase